MSDECEKPRADETTDVLVIGSGIAGLAAALSAASQGSDVVVATKAKRPEGASSWWAQGGIAVTRDDPEGFTRDILDASDGTAALDMTATDADGDTLTYLWEVTDGNAAHVVFASPTAEDTEVSVEDRDGNRVDVFGLDEPHRAPRGFSWMFFAGWRF